RHASFPSGGVLDESGALPRLGADLLAQEVDRHALTLDLDMPEDPAVAGRRALDLGADMVDRAAGFRRDDGAVGAHPGGKAPTLVEQYSARADEAALDQRAERNALLAALGRGVHEIGICRLDLGAALARQP